MSIITWKLITSCLCVFACFFSSLSLFGSISFLYFFFLQFISTLLSLSQFHHTQIQKKPHEINTIISNEMSMFLVAGSNNNLCVVWNDTEAIKEMFISSNHSIGVLVQVVTRKLFYSSLPCQWLFEYIDRFILTCVIIV